MRLSYSLVCGLMLVASACSDHGTADPLPPVDRIQLTNAQINSLDSSGVVMKQADSGNPDLQSLVDSTLLVLSAGVEAQRLPVTTDLTGSPLYFVGIHRVYDYQTGSSFSTWTLVGIDDPSHLTNLIEVSGFAQSAGTSAPTSVTGTIGDGSVNALLLQVKAGGSVTEWRAGSGSATFSSDEPGSACPGFTPIPRTVCSLETMHVHFTASAADGRWLGRRDGSPGGDHHGCRRAGDAADDHALNIAGAGRGRHTDVWPGHPRSTFSVRPCRMSDLD